jgi:hypothetical protein
VFGIFVLLNPHAWRQRDARELDEVERFAMRDNVIEAAMNVRSGCCRCCLAGFGGPRATAAGAGA